MSDLKPCLCGSDKVHFGYEPFCGLTFWRVMCDTCGTQTSTFDTKEEAAKVWNTRPAEDALTAEVKKLKVHCNALYDCLLVLQKFFEHGASDTELSKKVQEANLTMVENIVRVLVIAKKHGIDGTICTACKHRDCKNCDLDVILKIQQTANAPDAGKMEEN